MYGARIAGAHFLNQMRLSLRTRWTNWGLAEQDDTQQPLPDIEGNRGDYDIVTHTSDPGDVIVHHSNLIHGAGPQLHVRPGKACRFGSAMREMMLPTGTIARLHHNRIINIS